MKILAVFLRKLLERTYVSINHAIYLQRHIVKHWFLLYNFNKLSLVTGKSFSIPENGLGSAHKKMRIYFILYISDLYVTNIRISFRKDLYCS